MLPKPTFYDKTNTTEYTTHDFEDCDAGKFRPDVNGLEIHLWNDKLAEGSDTMTSVRIAVRDPDGGVDKVWTKQKWIEIKSNGVGGGDGIDDDAMTTFVKVGPNYNLCLGDIPKERYRKLFVRLHTPTDAEEQNISFQLKVKYQDSATDLIEVVMIHLQDVKAADDDYIHAAIPGTGEEQEITTDITNPDVPRNASIKTTAVATPSGIVKLDGINNLGQSASEEITIVAGSTVYGNVAWATLSKITIPAGVNASDTVTVGMSDKIGLITSIDNVDNVFKKKINNEDKSSEISSKVNKLYNTLDCATIIANAEITIWYIGRV
ncbi:hypothetical protein ES705_43566 [subsurface metagenome]